MTHDFCFYAYIINEAAPFVSRQHQIGGVCRTFSSKLDAIERDFKEHYSDTYELGPVTPQDDGWVRKFLNKDGSESKLHYRIIRREKAAAASQSA